MFLWPMGPRVKREDDEGGGVGDKKGVRHEKRGRHMRASPLCFVLKSVGLYSGQLLLARFAITFVICAIISSFVT